MGRAPTCKYTPSREGSNLPYWVLAASESGGKPQVPGVALVTIFGDKTPSIRIQVDPAKLASSGVTRFYLVDGIDDIGARLLKYSQYDPWLIVLVSGEICSRAAAAGWTSRMSLPASANSVAITFPEGLHLPAAPIPVHGAERIKCP
jgi:hypothetical protein